MAASEQKYDRYDTHLNVYYEQMHGVDVPALVAACTHPWLMVEGAWIVPTGD